MFSRSNGSSPESSVAVKSGWKDMDVVVARGSVGSGGGMGGLFFGSLGLGLD